MKATEVLNLLKVSRITLYTYVRTGKIKATKLHNGYYDYDQKSVYKLIGYKFKQNVIYARVSTSKQKEDLERQIKKINKFCDKNEIKIDTIYKDISSGIDLDRKEFSVLLDNIFEGKIDTIYITYTDRLTRLSFSTLKSIFSKFGTSICVIYGDDKNSDNDIFNDLTSLMHYFSTKKYSNRKNK